MSLANCSLCPLPPLTRSELLGLLRRHVSRPRAHGQRLDWTRGRGDTWVEVEAPGTVTINIVSLSLLFWADGRRREVRGYEEL